MKKIVVAKRVCFNVYWEARGVFRKWLGVTRWRTVKMKAMKSFATATPLSSVA